MYCPNCGAQNPETANTCSNCGFNLKGAAAPNKFKGTMLMMNSPLADGTPGATPPGAPPPPASVDAAAARRQMKGTIVGIAPPAPGAAPAPAPPTPLPPAPPPADPGAMSFSPPGGMGGNVNPMGSTFVADPPVAFPPPSPGFGGNAPFGAGSAAPPAAPEPAAYGAPEPAAYGAPPAYGAPLANTPPSYGAPPPADPGPSPYGAPGPGYGTPPTSLAPTPSYDTPAALLPQTQAPLVPFNAPAGAAGPVGTIRNPIAVFLMTAVCFLVGLAQLKSLEDELHAFLGDGKKASVLWFLFPLLPILSMPKLIADARAKAGTATQGEGNLIAYLFLAPYMLPKDANEIWERLGARPS